jgi:hypothetical protein
MAKLARGMVLLTRGFMLCKVTWHFRRISWHHAKNSAQQTRKIRKEEDNEVRPLYVAEINH